MHFIMCAGRWFWETDARTFEPYDDRNAEIIEAAWAADKSEVRCFKGFFSLSSQLKTKVVITVQCMYRIDLINRYQKCIDPRHSHPVTGKVRKVNGPARTLLREELKQSAPAAKFSATSLSEWASMQSETLATAAEETVSFSTIDHCAAAAWRHAQPRAVFTKLPV